MINVSASVRESFYEDKHDELLSILKKWGGRCDAEMLRDSLGVNEEAFEQVAKRGIHARTVEASSEIEYPAHLREVMLELTEAGWDWHDL